MKRLVKWYNSYICTVVQKYGCIFCNFHMVDYVMRTYSFFFKPLHKKAPFFTSFIVGKSTLLIDIFCFPYEQTKSNSISKLMWILDINIFPAKFKIIFSHGFYHLKAISEVQLKASLKKCTFTLKSGGSYQFWNWMNFDTIVTLYKNSKL